VQQAEGLAFHHGDLGLAGRAAGRVGRDQAEGVQPGVEALDAGQGSLGELDR
jgi:hypothetical protein